MDYIISEPIPPLRRDLDMAPITYQGQEMVLLSDAMGLRPDSFAVPPAAILIASFFDGKRRAEDVRAELSRQEAVFTAQEVQGIADEFKRCGLLETAETQQLRRKFLDEFRASPARKLNAKQRGLPENPLELGLMLGKFYKDAQGPGERFGGQPSGAPPVGLVSPHIDFFRGGPHYAWAYNELNRRNPPDVIVALGVAHVSPNSPWVMTQKQYETPLGPMQVDAGLYEEIRKQLWYDPLDEEVVHAKEHSLEFQAVWLKHVWMTDTPKWVPILCSSFENFCGDAQAPSKIPTIDEALGKIGEVLAKRAKQGQKILVLAGIDLAHVGARFGDELELTPELRQNIEKLDRESLEHALKLEADPFFLKGSGENGWRKICGLSALYTSLRWMKALGAQPGRLLSYGQADDPAGGVVSFTSAVFDK